MNIYRTASKLFEFVQAEKEGGKKVGFVPTMGALHQGHLSLIRQAGKISDTVVVSIFINPTQFNDSKDFEHYPRTPEKDLAALQKSRCKAVFLPTYEEMYPKDYVPPVFDLLGMDKIMEGKARPGHFQGVMQVVTRLLDIVQPDIAFFGEKDWQQYVIVKEGCKRLHYATEICVCPTFRNENGLAYSSRNELLTEKGKRKATFIFSLLESTKKYCSETGFEEDKRFFAKLFNGLDMNMEYFEIAEEETLQLLPSHQKGKRPRAFCAVTCEGIRLIDNMKLY